MFPGLRCVFIRHHTVKKSSRVCDVCLYLHIWVCDVFVYVSSHRQVGQGGDGCEGHHGQGRGSAAHALRARQRQRSSCTAEPRRRVRMSCSCSHHRSDSMTHAAEVAFQQPAMLSRGAAACGMQSGPLFRGSQSFVFACWPVLVCCGVALVLTEIRSKRTGGWLQRTSGRMPGTR